MQYLNQDTLYKGPHRLPDFGAEFNHLQAFREHFYRTEDNSYRERNMERMSLALHFGLGNQDVEFSSQAHTTSSGYAFFTRRSQQDDEYPMPVTNYIGEALDAEMAALGKRKLVPKVVPSNSDPKVEVAAKESTNILNDKLRKLSWPEQRKLGLVYFTNCGSVTYKTYWDRSYSNTRMQGSQEAVQCDSCGSVLQSPVVTTDERMSLRGYPNMAARPVKGQEDSFMLSVCPDCPDGALQPYEVGADDLESEDRFGRPMGQEEPVGEPKLEHYTPFQQFIENNGVGITPATVKLQGYVTPRSIDWLLEHYPFLMKETIEGVPELAISPDDPDELMKHHELLGEAALRYGYASGRNDPSIYDDHKLVYEVVQEKNYRFPKGRYLVMIKGYDQPLEDGPLYITVPNPMEEGEIEVPIVKFHTARYKVRAGEWYGKGLPDDLISSQITLNALDSMIIDAYERMGSPNFMAPADSNRQGPEWRSYGSARMLIYEENPLNPNAKPEVIEGRSVTASTFTFREAKLQDLKTLGAPKDVEIGEAPRNITTTTGLQLLSEQADRMRADAEDALVSIYESMWKHLLDLCWAFRVEGDEDYYETENSSGSWEKKQLINTVIAGQTQVKIEKQAYVDKSVFWKEAVREAQLDGLYDPNSPLSASVRIKLLEARGLPTEMVESENLQVKSARRQWIDFKDEGLIPTIDQSLDNAAIHFEELGNQLLTNDGRDMAEMAGWSEIIRRIAGWQDTFNAALQKDQAAREFYGGWQPPEVAQQLYMQAQQQYQQDLLQFQATQQQATQITLADEQTPAPEGLLVPPPDPPPPPQFLPNAMEDKILQIWTQLLNSEPEVDPATGQPVIDPQTGQQRPKPLPEPQFPGMITPNNPIEGRQQAAQKQQDFLRFRAVVEAYKVLADQDIQAQMLGELQSPAPSSQEGGGQRPSPFSKPQTPPTGGVKV